MSDRAIINLIQLKLIDMHLRIKGVVKSPLFTLDFLPSISIVLNDAEERKLEPRLSSQSYGKSREIEEACWFFEGSAEVQTTKKIEFIIILGEDIDADDADSTLKRANYRSLEYDFSFNELTSCFKDERHIIRGNFEIYIKENSIIVDNFTNKRLFSVSARARYRYFRRDRSTFALRNRAMKRMGKDEIWLYNDCRGVIKDNAYYQFEHDIEKNDGVKRYYIVNEENFEGRLDLYPVELRSSIIKFGSDIHRELFLSAKFVITAYIEKYNYNPFHKKVGGGRYEIEKFTDLFDLPEVIYLQHGVLHAHMPWKYSYDSNFVSRTVISTIFEESNLKENYAYSDADLMKCGMPRYDYIGNDRQHNTDSSDVVITGDEGKVNRNRKILYAPSWREYLIDREGKKWVPNEKLFLSSGYYKKTSELLNSEELLELLTRNSLSLEFKLHPIFEPYRHLYEAFNYDGVNYSEGSANNSSIKIVSGPINEADFDIFITDISSYVYDFVYLNTPIVYFMPDARDFKSSQNGYSELDMPMEDGLGPYTESPDDLIKELKDLIERDYKTEEKYRVKTNNMFFYHDMNQCDRIYKAMDLENNREVL